MATVRHRLSFALLALTVLAALPAQGRDAGSTLPGSVCAEEGTAFTPQALPDADTGPNLSPLDGAFPAVSPCVYDCIQTYKACKLACGSNQACLNDCQFNHNQCLELCA